jgi:hypothetical protein
MGNSTHDRTDRKDRTLFHYFICAYELINTYHDHLSTKYIVDVNLSSAAKQCSKAGGVSYSHGRRDGHRWVDNSCPKLPPGLIRARRKEKMAKRGRKSQAELSVITTPDPAPIHISTPPEPPAHLSENAATW